MRNIKNNLPGILKSGIKFSDLTSFTRQFAAMVEARINLVRVLDILSQQADNEMLNKILLHVRSEVQEGKTLTEAFSKYPTVFSTLVPAHGKVISVPGRL